MNLGHAHKTRFWYPLGVFSKFSDEHSRHFYRGVPPGGGGCLSFKAFVKLFINVGLPIPLAFC